MEKEFYIDLKYGDYFTYGPNYYVEFHYGTTEQRDKMFELFDKTLIRSYGSHSSRSSEGKDYIMPYLANEDGSFTTQNTGIIGGSSIPEDLLPEFIRRFVEFDKATVRVAGTELKDTFDYDEFDSIAKDLKGTHR